MGVPKRKPSRSRQRMRRAYNSVLTLAPTEHLPAMRRALCPASGLSRLRFLQRPPGPHRYRRSLIVFERGRADIRFRALSIYANRSGCHGWRPRLRGRHRRRQTRAASRSKDYRAFPGRQPGRNPAALPHSAVFAIIACGSSMPAKL